MSVLAAPILLACSGTQLALLEAPTSFTIELANDGIRGEGGPFVWVTEELRPTEKSLVVANVGQIFTGSDGHATLEMTLSADGSSVKWVVLEPTRRKGKYRIGISGKASCETTMKKAEA